MADPAGRHTFVSGLFSDVPEYTGRHFWVLPMLYVVDPARLLAAEESIPISQDDLVAILRVRCAYCGHTYHAAMPWLCEGDDQQHDLQVL